MSRNRAGDPPTPAIWAAIACRSCQRSPAPIEISAHHFCVPCALRLVQARKRLPEHAAVPPHPVGQPVPQAALT